MMAVSVVRDVDVSALLRGPEGFMTLCDMVPPGARGVVVAPDAPLAARLSETFGEAQTALGGLLAGCCVAGGAVSSFVDVGGPRTTRPRSDVDLFVFGPDAEQTIKAFCTVPCQDAVWVVKGPVLTCVREPAAPNIQLVVMGPAFASVWDVLESFDMPHLQVALHKGDLYLTRAACDALGSRVTYHRECLAPNRPARILKALQRGFTFRVEPVWWVCSPEVFAACEQVNRVPTVDTDFGDARCENAAAACRRVDRTGLVAMMDYCITRGMDTGRLKLLDTHEPCPVRVGCAQCLCRGGFRVARAG